jgi:hypothetical protein
MWVMYARREIGERDRQLVKKKIAGFCLWGSYGMNLFDILKFMYVFFEIFFAIEFTSKIQLIFLRTADSYPGNRDLLFFYLFMSHY